MRDVADCSKGTMRAGGGGALKPLCKIISYELHLMCYCSVIFVLQLRDYRLNLRTNTTAKPPA